MATRNFLHHYLDFLTKQALANPNELEEYTQKMVDEDEALIAGIVLDADYTGEGSTSWNGYSASSRESYANKSTASKQNHPCKEGDKND